VGDEKIWGLSLGEQLVFSLLCSESQTRALQNDLLIHRIDKPLWL
jgi:hypothetical protein